MAHAGKIPSLYSAHLGFGKKPRLLIKGCLSKQIQKVWSVFPCLSEGDAMLQEPIW